MTDERPSSFASFLHTETSRRRALQAIPVLGIGALALTLSQGSPKLAEKGETTPQTQVTPDTHEASEKTSAFGQFVDFDENWNVIGLDKENPLLLVDAEIEGFVTPLVHFASGLPMYTTNNEESDITEIPFSDIEGSYTEPWTFTFVTGDVIAYDQNDRDINRTVYRGEELGIWLMRTDADGNAFLDEFGNICEDNASRVFMVIPIPQPQIA